MASIEGELTHQKEHRYGGWNRVAVAAPSRVLDVHLHTRDEIMTKQSEFLANVPNLNISPAAFKPYVVHDGLIYVSGQLPVKDGKLVWAGRVPDPVTIEQAKEAAVLCMSNVLAWVKLACNGDFARVERCIRIGGFVSTCDQYYDAPAIINTASEIVTSAFGDSGDHCRIAIGVASLPLNAPVEIEATFAIR